MIFIDGKDPVILEDNEYPDWVFNLANPVSYTYIYNFTCNCIILMFIFVYIVSF